MGGIVNNFTDPDSRSILEDFLSRSSMSGFATKDINVIFTNNAQSIPSVASSLLGLRPGEYFNGMYSQYKGGSIWINPTISYNDKQSAIVHELLHKTFSKSSIDFGPAKGIHYPNFYFEQIVLMDSLGYKIPSDLVNKYKVSLNSFPKIAEKYGLSLGDLPAECFPASTPILTPSGTTSISHIQTGDTILSFDPDADHGRGALVERRVTKLFRNTTTEWIELDLGKIDPATGESFKLTCTPGHHFLDEFGNFPTIAELLLRGGGKAKIVLENGTLREVTGKRIVWSEETAHLYGGRAIEGTGQLVSGNLAFAEPAQINAWQTYNFEVEDLHTYVAGGVRVHNMSQPWTHEGAKVANAKYDYYTQTAKVPGDYAQKLALASLGVEAQAVGGVGKGPTAYTSSGRPIPIDAKVYDKYIESHGGDKASPYDRAEGALRAALEKGASRMDALAAANNELAKAGGNPNDQVNSLKLHKALDDVAKNGNANMGSSGKSSASPAPQPTAPSTGTPGGSSGKGGSGSNAASSSSNNGSSGTGGSGKSGGGGGGSSSSPSTSKSESKSGGSSGKPVLLDVSGNGINVNTLATSTFFVDLEGDGRMTRTAWAGEGTGVLVIDADGDGKISQEKEFAFTKWANGSQSDLLAIKEVFDTNGNGKLDAGDARFGEFRVWLNGSLVTLSSLGITSIDLTPTGSGQTLSDGSMITGMTTFTRSNGTTGAVGDAVLARDDSSYFTSVQTVTNGNGSKTTTTTATSVEGAIAFKTVLTESANGLLRSTQFDDDGDGTFDRSQTDNTVVNADTSRTRTTSDFSVTGALQQRQIITTSADRKTITTLVDQDGDAAADQSEVFQRNADGSSSTLVKELAFNGAIVTQTLSTGSANGLVKSISSDLNGDAVYDRVSSETTLVAADGVRTKTVTLKSANATLLGGSVTVTSANASSRRVDTDNMGDGTYDLREETLTTRDAVGTSTTVRSIKNADGSLRNSVTEVSSANGLTKTIRTDLTGDGIVDVSSSDVTTIATNGTRTRTETTSNGNGKLTASKISVVSADRKTITITTDANGDGATEQAYSKTTATTGIATTITNSLAQNGSLLGQKTEVVSADGLSITTQMDLSGDAIADRIQTEIFSTAVSGNKVKTTTLKNANNSIRETSVLSETADGKSSTEEVDKNGDGVVDRRYTITNTLNGDGSQTQIKKTLSSNSVVLESATQTISANRKTVTTAIDANGDGQNDQVQVETIAVNGDKNIAETTYNPNGTARNYVGKFESANGLSASQGTDFTNNGSMDEWKLKNTTLNADGSSTITNELRSNSYAVLAREVTTISGNKLSEITQIDANGDGVFEQKNTMIGVIANNGSTIKTESIEKGNGVLGSRLITTISANGLVEIKAADIDGNGVVDRTSVKEKFVFRDGSESVTIATLDANDDTVTTSIQTVSFDRLTSSTIIDIDNNGFTDIASYNVKNATGSNSNSIYTYNSNGSLRSSFSTSVSGNGLSKTTSIDINGDGTADRSISDTTTYASDGSEIEVKDILLKGVLAQRIVTNVSSNGFIKSTQWDIFGTGVPNRTDGIVTTLEAGGGTKEVRTIYENSVVKNIATTTISADQRTKIAVEDLNGDNKADYRTFTVIGLDGTKTVTNQSLAADGFTITSTKEIKFGNGTKQVWKSNGPQNQLYIVQSDVESHDTVGNKKVNTDYYYYNWNTNVNTIVEKYSKTTSLNQTYSKEEWDKNADGQFDVSRIEQRSIDTLGNTVVTISYGGAGGTLLSSFVKVSSASGLTSSEVWDLDGNGVSDQSSITNVTLNADGSKSSRVSFFAYNGPNIANIYTTEDPSQRLVTQKFDMNGNGSIDRSTLTQTTELADGSSSVATTFLGSFDRMYAVTRTVQYSDKSATIIESQLTGSAGTVQNLLAVSYVDGSRATMTTGFLGGVKKDQSIEFRSADGDKITTAWDTDGNGFFDRKRVTDVQIKDDGSSITTIVDKAFTAAVGAFTFGDNTNTNLKSVITSAGWLGAHENATADLYKSVISVNFDNSERKTEEYLNADSIVDRVIWQTNRRDGSWATTVSNTVEGAKADYLAVGAVHWKEIGARQSVQEAKRDGSGYILSVDYAGDGYSELVGNMLKRPDGSEQINYTERNSLGTIIATGIELHTADGRESALLKDSNNDTYFDTFKFVYKREDGTFLEATRDSYFQIKIISASGKVLTNLTTAQASVVNDYLATNPFTWRAASNVSLGTDGVDSLSGTTLGDAIIGGASNDVVNGLGGDDWLYGGVGFDTLNGNDGDDFHDGGLNADIMNGGLGNDFYLVDDVNDVVNELTAQGFDEILSNVSRTNAANVEKLVLAGSSAINAYGYASQNEQLIGNFAANIIFGYGGNDLIIGDGGADDLRGGDGDDTIIIDELDAWFSGDSGIDTIVYAGTATFQYALDQGAFENAEFASGNDTLWGGASANQIDGGAGNDTLFGYGGDDILIGGLGADSMQGGDGNDTVYIDKVDTWYSGDVGVDTVVYQGTEAFQYALDQGAFENANFGSGNDTIWGNAAANRIDGGAGNDTIFGYGADDTLIGGAGIDSLQGGDGNDQIIIDEFDSWFSGDAGIDTLSYTGKANIIYALDQGAFENVTTGAGNDTIYGNISANLINSGAGNDQVIGGAGNDVFIFNSTLSATTNVDTITDFAVGQDVISLENAIFTGLTATGALSANLFKNIAAAAVDADDKILFNSNNGELFYDADGAGASLAIKFATLTTGLGMTSAQFTVT